MSYKTKIILEITKYFYYFYFNGNYLFLKNYESTFIGHP